MCTCDIFDNYFNCFVIHSEQNKPVTKRRPYIWKPQWSEHPIMKPSEHRSVPFVIIS